MTSFLLANCEHFKRAIDANNQLCKKLILNKVDQLALFLTLLPVSNKTNKFNCLVNGTEDKLKQVIKFRFKDLY